VEVLVDRVEAVLDARPDVDDRPPLHRTVRARDADLPATGHHDVDLVLGVRPLGVLAARGPDRQAEAEHLLAQEVHVGVLAGPVLRGDEVLGLEGVHAA
jgi:hypothetical protein